MPESSPTSPRPRRATLKTSGKAKVRGFLLPGPGEDEIELPEGFIPFAANGFLVWAYKI